MTLPCASLYVTYMVKYLIHCFQCTCSFCSKLHVPCRDEKRNFVAQTLDTNVDTVLKCGFYPVTFRRQITCLIFKFTEHFSSINKHRKVTLCIVVSASSLFQDYDILLSNYISVIFPIPYLKPYDQILVFSLILGSDVNY